MGFTDSFARTLPAAARAFGITAVYNRGPDDIDITMFVGPRDLAGRNTLGSEFAHINTKEFVIPAASLSVANVLFLPAGGHTLTWTDPQTKEQDWTVFPLWNDRSFDRLDLAESQLRFYAVASGDTSQIGLRATWADISASELPQYLAVVGLLGITEVTVPFGTSERVTDRDICRLIAVCPPGTFATDMQVTVPNYPGGDFFVKSIENVSPTSTRLELWRDSITKIQRAGTEGSR